MNDLEMVNRALALLGDFKVDDLDPATLDSDTRAEIASRMLPIAKREVLSTMDWRFASTDAELAAAAAPILHWNFQHTLPAMCHRVIGVHAAGEAGAEPDAWTKLNRFSLAGGNVQSNDEFIAVEYVGDADFAVWSYKAQTACARLLAHYCAVPIRGDQEISDKMLAIYDKRDLPAAQYEEATQWASNENYQPNQPLEQSNLIQQRHRGLTGLSSDI